MPLSASYRFAQEYQRNRIETSSPVQLVVMLYDGAIRFLCLAKERMQAGDLEGRHSNLLKAQRIVGELISSLNRDKGGDLAANLQNLYAFMLKQLVEANLYDRHEPIDKVIGMMRELRESWAEIDTTSQGTRSADSNEQDS